MKSYKKILICFLTLFLCLTGSIDAKKNYKLCFKPDSTFKIVQFTDMHIAWQNPNSEPAYECVDHVIKAERPDFIILTGDIIFSRTSIENFKKIINYISSYKIPFAFVFGNHDHQFDATDSALLSSVKDVPYNMTVTAPGISGDSNFNLPIYSQDNKTVESVIYGIDSHDSSHLEKEGVKGYDYIYRDQIDWYVATSRNYTKANHNVPVPSVAFFHIPLPEFSAAASNEGTPLFGNRTEKVCCPNVNSGLFTAMVEQGDIMGIFCGHDHDNDYAAKWYNILLAYGRYSGGMNVYNHLKGNGARVIKLEQGKRSFHTWIRLTDGTTQQETEFPKDYLR